MDQTQNSDPEWVSMSSKTGEGLYSENQSSKTLPGSKGEKPRTDDGAMSNMEAVVKAGLHADPAARELVFLSSDVKLASCFEQAPRLKPSTLTTLKI